MKFSADFFKTSTGQLSLLVALALLIVGMVAWQKARRQPVLSAKVRTLTPMALPKVFTRDIPRISKPAPTNPPQAPAASELKPPPGPATAPPPATPAVLPVGLFSTPPSAGSAVSISAPYGRMIPCATIVALESSRIDTPVVGLVTDDVYENGQIIIPTGSEVHGRAALDRTRERIAVNGRWIIVWRPAPHASARELVVEGMALEREFDRITGSLGEADGSAGIRGTVVRADDLREAKMFAATFLSTATSALQDMRASAGLLGEFSLPATTARNATLAGAGSVLREYAQQLREAIARDGFYLRVPAGKPFYLYVTETLNPNRARVGAHTSTTHAK